MPYDSSKDSSKPLNTETKSSWLSLRSDQITQNNVFSQVYSQVTKYSLHAIQDHMYPAGQISCGTLHMQLCEELVTAPQTCHEAC